MKKLLFIPIIFLLKFLELEGQTAPIVGTITQPTCSIGTGSVILSGLPDTGTWTLTRYPDSSTSTGTGTSTLVTGLASGTYTFTVTNESGGTSPASGPVVIDTQPTIPPAATFSITQPTCTVATGTITITAPLGSYEYNLDGGSYQSAVVFSGIVPGAHTILVRRPTDNTCVSAPVSATVNAQPSTPSSPGVGTITQPTCAVGIGSVVLNGLPAGNWVINPGNIPGSTLTTTISGLSAGTYNYTVTNSQGCTSLSSADIVINAQPTAPAAATVSIMQPTCAIATATIIVTAPLGSYQYNLDGGAYQAGTAFSGVTTGSHTILVRRSTDFTCISSPASATVNAQPTSPSAATVSITQPTCAVATGTITVTAPLGSYEYNIDGGAYQSGTTFAGFAAGSHVILVRRSSDFTCISSPASATLNAPPTAPPAATLSITQPTCAVPTGTISVTAPLGSYEYNLDGGAYQSGTSFSGVVAGSHSILVRRTTDLTCTSSLASATVNAQPAVPAAATVSITQPTCAIATATIIVTAPLGSYEYNLDGGIYQSGTAFSGVTTGSHTIYVRRSTDFTCISSPASAIVNAQPTVPSTATINITQPTCAVVTGTISVVGPIGAYEYNLDGGSYQSAVSFSGVAPGTHTILVRRAIDNTCISSPASATINAQPSVPATATVNIIQPTCATATGTITIVGPIGAYEYNLDGGLYQTSVIFSGVISGSHSIRVRRSSDNTCISPLTTATINIQPATPPAPSVGTITQPTCTVATGSVVLTGLPAGSWIINPGNRVGSATSTIITGLVSGTYSYTVTNTDGCSSSASSSITINQQPSTPGAPVIGNIIQPTCTVSRGSVLLTGLPSSGSWTITRSPDGSKTSGSGTSTTIAGLASDTYSFTVTNASGCVSATSDDAEIETQPSTPGAPSIGTRTHPTCTVPTGSVVLNNLPSSGSWTLTRSPGNVTSSGTGTSTTLGGLVSNTYTFTVTNASGCTSATSGNVVINSQPATPTAPVIGTVTQPTFSVPTGSVIITGLPANGSWMLMRNPGGNTIAGTGTNTTITGLSAGTYTFTVTNSSGCISTSSSSAVLNSMKLLTSEGKSLRPNDTVKIDNTEAGSFLINVESNSDWTVSDNSIWFKAVKENATSSIKINYQENISVLEKVASLKVTYALNPDFVVNIKQKARISQLRISKLDAATMYPNPADNIVYLKLGEDEFDKIIASISSIQGHILTKREFNNLPANQVIELNISSLPVGQYLVRITDGRNFKVFQLVKF